MKLVASVNKAERTANRMKLPIMGSPVTTRQSPARRDRAGRSSSWISALLDRLCFLVAIDT